jgi:hypothetical protein
MPAANNKVARRLTSILILALILVPLLLEFVSDRLEARDVKSQNTWVRFFQSAFWYQTVVTAGERKPRDHFVRIVTLVRHREPDEIFYDYCKQRLLMAKLISNIQQARPAVIVVDKFFSAHSCPDPMSEGNQSFRQVLKTSSVPIVMGLQTSDPEELEAQGSLETTETMALKRANLVLEPAFKFDAGDQVLFGLTRLDRDTRKIPLQWYVYGSRADLSSNQAPQKLPTLSHMAAEQYDPTVFSRPDLKAVLAAGVDPFTSFLKESEIPTFAAIDLVCDPALPKPAKWEDCPPDRYGSDLLKNHIIVVGNRTTEDFHASVIGTVPGVVLQANYIESLLDDRYFKPVPFWAAFLVNALLLLLIVLIFYWAMRTGNVSPETALGASLLVICSAWILTYLLTLHLGYYLVVWFPGGVALVALWAEERRLRLLEHEHKT